MELITLEEYKIYKGISKADQDNKINLIIPSVSNIIKAYIGTSLVDHYNDPITETHTVEYPTNEIYTRHWPINEVISVTERDRSYWDSTVHLPLVSGVDYVVEDGYLVRTGPYSVWTTGPSTVVIEYTYGYETLPQEIKLAALELTSYYMNSEFKESRSIQGTTIVNKVSSEPDLPPYIRAILDFYKV